MTKTRKIIYWIATIWLSLGMLSSAIVQIMRIPEGMEAMARLGYPAYFFTILGVWKIFGVIALLIPGFALVKEWAYAGFFFVATGAAISHIASNDPIGEVFPGILLMVLTVVSWYLRPESRKVPATATA